jgi:hypothetical protein
LSKGNQRGKTKDLFGEKRLRKSLFFQLERVQKEPLSSSHVFLVYIVISLVKHVERCVFILGV